MKLPILQSHSGRKPSQELCPVVGHSLWPHRTREPEQWYWAAPEPSPLHHPTVEPSLQTHTTADRARASPERSTAMTPPQSQSTGCGPTWPQLPWCSGSEESACNAGHPGSIPGLGRSPGERNGKHSSILSWRILWTEEAGRLQSMRLQRVGHDWATKHTPLDQKV